MASVIDRLQDAQALDFIAKIEDAFKTLPRLPEGFIEFLVKIAPWMALIGGILSLIAGPVIGLAGALSLITLNPLLVVATFIAAVISLMTAALLLMAFGPLKNREFKGWIFLFWSEILGIVSQVVALLTGSFSVFSVIFAILWLYILFEMKPKYNPVAAAVEKVKAPKA